MHGNTWKMAGNCHGLARPKLSSDGRALHPLQDRWPGLRTVLPDAKVMRRAATDVSSDGFRLLFAGSHGVMKSLLGTATPLGALPIFFHPRVSRFLCGSGEWLFCQWVKHLLRDATFRRYSKQVIKASLIWPTILSIFHSPYPLLPTFNETSLACVVHPIDARVSLTIIARNLQSSLSSLLRSTSAL